MIVGIPALEETGTWSPASDASLPEATVPSKMTARDGLVESWLFELERDDVVALPTVAVLGLDWCRLFRMRFQISQCDNETGIRQ